MSMPRGKLRKRGTTVGNLKSVTCTREWLSTPSQLAPQGRRNFRCLKAWKHGCTATIGTSTTPWLDHNKGDTLKPEHQSRRVVQRTRRTPEIPQDDVGATTSATPPSEVVRLVCNLAMSMPGATILGCLATTPSLQRSQRQRVHRSSEGVWLGPVTVLATQEMLVRDT